MNPLLDAREYVTVIPNSCTKVRHPTHDPSQSSSVLPKPKVYAAPAALTALLVAAALFGASVAGWRSLARTA